MTRKLHMGDPEDFMSKLGKLERKSLTRDLDSYLLLEGVSGHLLVNEVIGGRSDKIRIPYDRAIDYSNSHSAKRIRDSILITKGTISLEGAV